MEYIQHGIKMDILLSAYGSSIKYSTFLNRVKYVGYFNINYENELVYFLFLKSLYCSISFIQLIFINATLGPCAYCSNVGISLLFLKV